MQNPVFKMRPNQIKIKLNKDQLNDYFDYNTDFVSVLKFASSDNENVPSNGP